MVLTNVSPVVRTTRFFVGRRAGEDVSTVKKREACREEEIRVYERLTSLDEETQERISQKYYRGTRPWQPRMQEAAKKRRRRKSPERTE